MQAAHLTFGFVAALLPTPQVGRPEPSLEDCRLAVIPDGLELEEPSIQVEGKEWRHVNAVVWSPDGARVAYVGWKGGRLIPVVGEVQHGAYDYVSGPVLDERGECVVFRVGKRTGKASETWWVLVNGQELGKEDWIGEVGVSSDGQRIAYWTQPGAKIEDDGAYNRGRQVLVVGARKNDKWSFHAGDDWEDARSLVPPLFSRDAQGVLDSRLRACLFPRRHAHGVRLA